MKKTILKEIRNWMRDFEDQNRVGKSPLISYDDNTFEGSAYQIFKAIERGDADHE